MTVLDVQPRMVSSGGGKTSDEIVYELAENILGKLPDNLDMDKASKALFEVKLHLGSSRLIFCNYGETSKHFIFLIFLLLLLEFLW